MDALSYTADILGTQFVPWQASYIWSILLVSSILTGYPIFPVLDHILAKFSK